MRKKKILCAFMIMAAAVSMTACTLPERILERVQTTEDEDIIESTEDDERITEAEDSDDRYASSSEVIEAYWQAFSDLSLSEFETVFPEDQKDVADEQYDFALDKSETITVKNVEITETSSYDLEDLEFDADKYNVAEAEHSLITVHMDQKVNDAELDVNDYYEVITIKKDGSWYIAKIHNLGAEENHDGAEENNGSGDSDDPIRTEDGSHLDSDVKEKLDALDTDYSKVNWGVQYSPFEDEPGLVISVAPYVDEYGTYKLIVGITNLLDTPITFSGGAEAKGKDESIVGETYIYEDSLGVGNTVIEIISCDDIPDGRIHWTDLKMQEGDSRYIPWEADWELLNGDDKSEIIFKYNLYANEPFVAGYIYGLALDQDGNVVYVFDAYEDELTSNLTGSVTTYEDLSARGLKDVALFSNSLAE